MRPEKERGPRGHETLAETDTDQPQLYTADGAIRRLDSYRSTAQAIRRADGTLGQKMASLIRLSQRARRERDPWVRELAEAIVSGQASWLLEGAAALERSHVRDRLESAARRLRAQGRETCPTCAQRVSDPSDWVFWRAMREAEIARLRTLDAEVDAA